MAVSHDEAAGQISRSASVLSWILALAYAVALTIVSLMPSGHPTSGGWDSGIGPTTQNVLHVPAYGLLAVVLLAAVARTSQMGPLRAGAVAVACVLYGAALEWLQATLIPGRTGAWSDVLWNAVGVTAGGLVWLLLAPRRTQSREGVIPPEESAARL
ncbi:MAG: VanZ family protein [Pirellulaceae bacterium]